MANGKEYPKNRFSSTEPNRQNIPKKKSFKGDNVKIETIVLDKSTIEQTETATIRGIVSHRRRTIMHVSEKHIKDALIELGWHPPGTTCICDYCGYSLLHSVMRCADGSTVFNVVSCPNVHE